MAPKMVADVNRPGVVGSVSELDHRCEVYGGIERRRRVDTRLVGAGEQGKQADT